MADSLIKTPEKRVAFSQGEQRKFLLKVNKNSGLAWSQIASRIKISKRTLFDWRREKYTMGFSSLKKMCEFAKLKYPTDIKIRSAFWSVKKAAKIGGLVTYHRYGTIGNPLIRKQRWLEWWEKIGKHNPNKYFVVKEIIKPKKSSRLAEFVGIVMGDGGITKRQLTITLNSITDKAYSVFVEKLIGHLFGVKPSVCFGHKDRTIRIVVSRTNLVVFCQTIELKVGNKIKQNLDIPTWIKKNKKYLISCIRGLMDTDGCLFMERHKIKGKIYSYPRLSLVSYSPSLRLSVYNALKKLGFSPRIRSERSVQLENYFEIKEYFDKIGSNNQRNREKFLILSGGFG